MFILIAYPFLTYLSNGNKLKIDNPKSKVVNK